MTLNNISAERQVWQKQLEIYARQVPTIIMGYFLATTLMTIALWQHTKHELLLIWFFASFVFVLLPFLMGKLYFTSNHLLSTYNWYLFFVTFALVAGIHWGLSITLFANVDNYLHFALITILTLGVLSGALYGMSLLPPAYFLFLSPVIAQFVWVTAYHEQLYPLIAAATGLSLLLAWLSHQLYRVNSETLLLHFQNDRLSQTLQKEKDDIEKASHAKTQFIATVSHDMRQPLQAQRLFAESIAAQSSDTEVVQLSEYILESQASMQSMLDTLLDISRLNAGTIKPQFKVLSMTDLFRSLEQEFSLAAEAQGLQLVIHWPPANTLIFSDHALLESILRNLLSNAIRYTTKGSIMLAVRKRGEHWRIEVRDSGIGIPHEQQEHIFEEFQQLGNPERDQAKGLGLGLSIVRRLCTLMYYPVTLRSCPNHGSTFAVQIPSLDDISLEPAQQDNELHLESFKNLRVLVVDDDIAIRQGFKRSLSLYGLYVDAVATTSEAITQLKTYPPDIIITDYRLANNETGILLLEQVAQQTEHIIPAIIITGDTAPHELQALNGTHYTVMHKPVRVIGLLFEIQRLLHL